MRFLFFFILLFVTPSIAQERENPFRSTAYPLPRFVSLASDKIYVRTGPGMKYPVLWEFQRAGLPVEIILEFDHWRKIKDHEGQTGWIHKSLLSGKRSGLVQSGEVISLLRKAHVNAALAAYLEPNVVVKLKECGKEWCYVDASGYKGWAEKKYLWGVYPEEIIEK